MTMGALIPITGAGVATNLLAMAASETIQAIDDLILHVHNSSGSSVNITITDAGSTPGGTTGSGVVVAVANNVDKFIAIPAAFAAPTTGLITVTPSTTNASLTAEWLTR